MKTHFLQGIFLGILAIFLFSCESQDDSIKVNSQVASSNKKAATITCDKLFNSPDDYLGQEISLNAICWGMNASVDGEEILMSLDDQELVGLQQAHVLVHFDKNQEAEIKNISKNDSISITAKVDSLKYGALRLVDAKVKLN